MMSSSPMMGEHELPASYGPGAAQAMASQAEVMAVLHSLANKQANGRSVTQSDQLYALRRLAELGAIQTLEMLLPLALTLNGHPYTLTDHFPFSPLYRTRMPNTLLLKTGRQTSKSTNLASHGVLLSNCIPYFRTLYITPLYEQIRRFSNNYVRPFIDRSPIRSLWSGTTTENSVLQRSFKNLSTMLFSFALLDADRIRGISADCICVDELQDFDPDHLPIIRECMSHSRFKLMRLAGTPKTLDGSIESVWRRSSQAEWIIPCHRCGQWNIPCLEFHVDAMIGPLHDNIGPNCPGTVCFKCRQPINPRHGHWLHRYPNRRWTLAGYHIPQIILPLHYANRKSWAELLAKREGWGNTPTHVFYNEVLGESVDTGQKLVSESELRKAACLPWKNRPNNPDVEVMKRLRHYQMRLLAVDWGGGGEDGVSFTTLALLGFTAQGKIDCLWGKRLVASQEHFREAKECLHWIEAFRCDLMAHDYTGAGTVRETILIQAGFEMNRVIPIQYVRAASRNLFRFMPASVLHNRDHYSLDKTRSLLYTFQAIKLGLLRFFEYDYINDDDRGLISDFLALLEEKTESRLAGDIYSIIRNQSLTDDFAQAVNIGCAALWHVNNAWPNFAAAAAIGKVTAAQILSTGSKDYGWEEDRQMAGFLGQP
jgi:hypothetical protein